MRSRLPGKLRSSALAFSAVIVKNRARFTKCRLVMRGAGTQILHESNQAPRQHEAEAQKQ
jgi:hypothetical protein